MKTVGVVGGEEVIAIIPKASYSFQIHVEEYRGCLNMVSLERRFQRIQTLLNFRNSA
jgi:hypothetical protein